MRNALGVGLKSEIELLSEVLNDTIEKGEKLAKKHDQLRKSRARSASNLMKALPNNVWNPSSFNPMDYPHIPNHYRQAPEGGFFPHNPDHWKKQGVKGEYNNVREFYNRYMPATEKIKTFRGFSRTFMKSIKYIEDDALVIDGDLCKAITGSKHKINGSTYKKTQDGWQRIKDEE